MPCTSVEMFLAPTRVCWSFPLARALSLPWLVMAPQRPPLQRATANGAADVIADQGSNNGGHSYPAGGGGSFLLPGSAESLPLTLAASALRSPLNRFYPAAHLILLDITCPPPTHFVVWPFYPLSITHGTFSQSSSILATSTSARPRIHFSLF